jgi:hypothetical protein
VWACPPGQRAWARRARHLLSAPRLRAGCASLMCLRQKQPQWTAGTRFATLAGGSTCGERDGRVRLDAQGYSMQLAEEQGQVLQVLPQGKARGCLGSR